MIIHPSSHLGWITAALYSPHSAPLLSAVGLQSAAARVLTRSHRRSHISTGYLSPTPSLRSDLLNLLSVPGTCLRTHGDRAFAAVAPRLWIFLPAPLRLAESLVCFKPSFRLTCLERLLGNLYGSVLASLMLIIYLFIYWVLLLMCTIFTVFCSLHFYLCSSCSSFFIICVFLYFIVVVKHFVTFVCEKCFINTFDFL